MKAKLPSGDWIYPRKCVLLPKKAVDGRFCLEIRLTSAVQRAEIWIAYARGNKVLTGNNHDDLGASILFGGLAQSVEEPKRSELLRSLRSDQGTLWTDDFHNYTLLWEPS